MASISSVGADWGKLMKEAGLSASALAYPTGSASSAPIGVAYTGAAYTFTTTGTGYSVAGAKISYSDGSVKKGTPKSRQPVNPTGLLRSIKGLQYKISELRAS